MAENIYFRSIIAVPAGLRICLTEQKIRHLALRPWLVGIVSYILTLAAAFYYHGTLVECLSPDSSAWWASLLHIIAWLLSAGFLLILSMVISLAAVMIFAGVYQSMIAEEVCRTLGIIPGNPLSTESFVKNFSRTAITEMLKFAVLLPVIAFTFFLGLIPFLAPFALLFGAWLLAFQFVDLVFEANRISLRSRFVLSLRFLLLFISFGLALSFFWAIPLLGLLLLPAAAAGAAWLFATPALGEVLLLHRGKFEE